MRRNTVLFVWFYEPLALVLTSCYFATILPFIFLCCFFFIIPYRLFTHILNLKLNFLFWLERQTFIKQTEDPVINQVCFSRYCISCNIVCQNNHRLIINGMSVYVRYFFPLRQKNNNAFNGNILKCTY